MPEPTVIDARLRAAADSLRKGSLKVLSIDIFDTLLWRRVPEPADVFLMLGGDLKAAGRLAPGITAVAFAEARRAGERAAREKVQAVTGYREVKLPDIYAAMPGQLFAGSFDPAAAEVACEQRLLTHDHALAALMDVARAAGAKAILVSDTYFTVAEIKALLAAAGMRSAFDHLYVSCETGKPKYRDLFDVVLKDMGVAPAEMLHIGDSYEADVAPCAARRIGHVHYDKWHFAPRVQAKEFPADLMARDAALGGAGDFGLTGLRSRLRHRVPADVAPVFRPYWQIGASALAAPFTAFARWVVGEATGAERVFGLMREGRFLGEVVTATAMALGVSLKTEELWLSRRAVIGAALYPDDLSLLGDFIMLASGANAAEVLDRIGLAPADVPGLDFARDGALPALVQAIARRPALRDKVLAVSARHRRNLLAGLGKQINLAKPQRISVMDLGYAATIQAVLARILAREGSPVTVQGLYFALNDTGLARRSGGLAVKSFLGDQGLPVARLLSRTPDVLEHACMCREGSLAAYDEAGVPVLLPNLRDEAQLAQMETLQAGIKAGLAEVNVLLGDFGRTPHDSLALAAQAGRMVEAMILYPTAEEAATVGGWLHEANFDLADRRKLTDLAFDAAQLEYRGLAALQDIGRHQAYWPAAALARVNPFLAEAYAAGAASVEGGGGYGPAQLTAGPVLGGLVLTPDLGAGFDPKRGGGVALAVNAFGRAEITVPIKSFGADAYRRIKLTWPAAAAVAALDQVSIIAQGERETRRVEITSQEWSGAGEIAPGTRQIVSPTSGSGPAEVILTLSDPPAFAHALEMTLRLKYLRLDPLFGGRA
ncbi:MAG: HAD family hydrolase [Rhodospirillaceae bacterium]|nr:HAD family hydrolase [Rhodospirillaceae bacterium]